ncbi:MAG TPA: chloride channel protein, partial [Polyangiaceae bacterium]|nr:chloride channel protein [Polyangiaceae bacterium]
FRLALLFVLRHASGTGDIVSALGSAPVAVRIALPALGGLLAGVIGMLLARAPPSHGVGDVMEAVVLGRVHLSMRVTLLKSLASWLAIAAGGSIGREGPLIQFGGAVGKFVSDRFRLSNGQARILIAAGTAAGFAAAYNTPFAAVLFVLEVVAGVVVLETMVPALIATVLATALTRVVVGSGPVYGERAFVLRSPLELLAFAGLGIGAALVAQGFMRLLSLGEKCFRRPAFPLPWRPAVGGLVAGLFIAGLPEVAGNGYEPLNAVLDARFSAAFVAVLLVGKALATTASVSSGSPGGVFTPSLLLGGCAGFLYALALERAAGVVIGPAGGYALVGMAAVTAATTHAPLMAAVMAFELSGDYAIVLPLVLATAVSTATSRALRKDSIYTAELSDRGAWELARERMMGE